MSKSGNPSRGQGFDFLLEEENKVVLKWIQRGVATNEHWQNVIRSKDNLEAIHSLMKETLDLDDSESGDKKIDLSNAVREW